MLKKVYLAKKYKGNLFMSSPALLMPKATAVWLVENTSLTFQQIADFCSLHVLEIQSLADEDYGVKIKGLSPVVSGQLTREEIDRCEKDQKAVLKIKELPSLLKKQKKAGKKYTPIAKRQDKPDAIHFLLKKYPNLQDVQICKLIGTTKSTVESIRSKAHWKTQTMRDIDPVIVGFCSQTELDAAIKRADSRVEKERGVMVAADPSQTLADPNSFDTNE